MTEKELIKNNFSKCAKVYDCYSNIQNLCAENLIKKADTKGFNKILDIGCGTGNYTRLIKQRFPESRVKAVDISKEMIRVSRRKLKSDSIEFITADAEEVDFKEKFDLITSNVSFQWFGDLETALTRYTKFLKQGGLILFSIFGPRTFFELAKSLGIFSRQNPAIAAAGFLDKTRIEAVLKSIFSQVKVEEETYSEQYSSLKDLLKKIKYTGTRGSPRQNFWSQSKIAAVEEIYFKNFKSITATYEVYFCQGIK